MDSQRLDHVRKLAVAARDNPATWDDRDCPMIALIGALDPASLVELIDDYTAMRRRIDVVSEGTTP